MAVGVKTYNDSDRWTRATHGVAGRSDADQRALWLEQVPSSGWRLAALIAEKEAIKQDRLDRLAGVCKGCWMQRSLTGNCGC